MSDTPCLDDRLPTAGFKPLPQALRKYRGLRALARLHGFHLDCPRRACRRAKACLGGPRGTFRRSGIPACLAGEALRLPAALPGTASGGAPGGASGGASGKPDGPGGTLAARLIAALMARKPRRRAFEGWNRPMAAPAKPQHWSPRGARSAAGEPPLQAPDGYG